LAKDGFEKQVVQHARFLTS